MENKGPFVVRELRAMNTGQQIFGKFLLLDKVHRKTKDGKDMYNIKLGDASGDIDGVIWENCQIAGEFQAGDVLGLLGDIGNFNGKTQVNVKRLKVLNEDPSTYMKTPLISRSELEKKFEEYL
ncbi:MAG: OB-fold nucleic acid binding domain-containing protein, partial [Syntrophomonas sp.]|nr:OB-fold nucleic acid binding domain-containing protein [Syntrophomonas sp.]